jgi:hypothetical protein
MTNLGPESYQFHAQIVAISNLDSATDKLRQVEISIDFISQIKGIAMVALQIGQVIEIGVTICVYVLSSDRITTCI